MLANVFNIYVENSKGAIVPESSALVDPILNGPYDIPAQHFEMGPKGPTGQTLPGRRPSESFIPIAAATKGADGSVQATLEFEGTLERRETDRRRSHEGLRSLERSFRVRAV